MYEKEIELKMRELPEDLRSEVLAYAEFLSKRNMGKRIEAKTFKFDWEGGLSKMQESFTSTDLQHKTSEWR